MIPMLIGNAKRYAWAMTALERAVEEARGGGSAAAEEAGEEEQGEISVNHYRKEVRPRKKPVPWTEEEEAFLINLISEEGPKWSDFEQFYGNGELFGRDQTAMKDKARNIMRRVIDSGRLEEWYQLHPNWRKVSVGAARRGVHAYEPGTVPIRVHKGKSDIGR